MPNTGPTQRAPIAQVAAPGRSVDQWARALGTPPKPPRRGGFGSSQCKVSSEDLRGPLPPMQHREPGFDRNLRNGRAFWSQDDQSKYPVDRLNHWRAFRAPRPWVWKIDRGSVPQSPCSPKRKPQSSCSCTLSPWPASAGVAKSPMSRPGAERATSPRNWLNMSSVRWCP